MERMVAFWQILGELDSRGEFTVVIHLVGTQELWS